MTTDLTQARLKELLDYDPATGVFTWRVGRSGKARVGSVAGSPDGKGYIRIKIDYQKFRAHRLAFLYMTGAWPREQADHINGSRDDNRWANLRPATSSENKHNIGGARRNNTSGYLGVSGDKGTGKWVARIRLDGRNRHLGYFTDPAEAGRAYLAAKDELHPTHQRLREDRP